MFPMCRRELKGAVWPIQITLKRAYLWFLKLGSSDEYAHTFFFLLIMHKEWQCFVTVGKSFILTSILPIAKSKTPAPQEK